MTKKWKLVCIFLASSIVVLVSLYFFVFRNQHVTWYTGNYGDVVSDTSCTVLGVNVHGDIMTYVPPSDTEIDAVGSEDILYALSTLEDAPYVKAVILDIDSYGGSAVAAEEIATALSKLPVPVVAVVRGAATSAAYWIASASDHIIASRFSDVGGIGVTMSYIDESKVNQKEGYTWNSLSIGRFKDAGNPQKPLTREERALFERDLAIVHTGFIDAVTKNRGLDRGVVTALADGATMLGEQARTVGLIDAVGSFDDAYEYLRATYGIESVVCVQ